MKYGTKIIHVHCSLEAYKLLLSFLLSPSYHHHYYLTIASFVLGGSVMIQPTSPEIHPKKHWVFNRSKPPTQQPTDVDQPLQSHRVVQCHWCVESTRVQLEALGSKSYENSVGIIFWLVPVPRKKVVNCCFFPTRKIVGNKLSPGWF